MERHQIKFLTGHRVGDQFRLTGDIVFFRGKEFTDDYDTHVEYHCPALQWSVWVSVGADEKQEVREQMEVRAATLLTSTLPKSSEKSDLRVRLLQVVQPLKA